ncbi:DDE-type integrase/transposase/recombinase [Microaerobacter geothermalis]|uniref:helix-turn-helix domain-containing protein n=1 Tax=Microaerobacter geothermalis TaxID=674972 RepID=UPI001F3A9C07|nr:helix-turn-helix domain-containing protein [Microaerobacter geothermalis]MCF6094016.1 DDE-type integrase/transposase/recombinase [Microaerobacter geothermalis]
MDEKTRESIALFRFGLIAPLMNGQVKDPKAYLQKLASQKHQVPYYGEREFVAKTIQSWLRCYQRYGFEALKPKHRSDRGTSRALTSEDQDHLLSLRKKHPGIPASVFYDQLIEDGEILPKEVSYTTIYRLLKKHGLLGKELLQSPDRKRFAYDTVNMLWQGDLSEGVYLSTDSGKKLKTYLIAFIDDCSRIVPFAQFFPNEKFDGLRTVFKEALIRRGLPKIVYADNGKIYRADTLHVACASLGITLTHTQPYDAASKGKIERFFRTVKTRFFTRLRVRPATSLQELNERFWQWLEEDYHRKPHASLEGKTPLEVYLSQVDRVRMLGDPALLDPLFLKRDHRKVKHDATFSLHGQLYEVPPRFIGQRIEVRYDESNIWVYEDGQAIIEAKPVNFTDNAHVKRDRPQMSFQSLTEEGEHV